MYLMDGILVISARPSAAPSPVAELYRQVGFEACGRWGELYL